MANVTANQNIKLKDEATAIVVALPVASGETIYQGTVGALVTASGLLADLDASNKAISNFVGIVADDTANATGPGATTSAGSISGSRQEASADAGDKTVRRVYVKGRFELPLSSASQTDVGLPIYASENFTFTTTSTDNAWLGTITAWVDDDTVEVLLNESLAI